MEGDILHVYEVPKIPGFYKVLPEIHFHNVPANVALWKLLESAGFHPYSRQAYLRPPPCPNVTLDAESMSVEEAFRRILAQSPIVLVAYVSPMRGWLKNAVWSDMTCWPNASIQHP